MEPKQQGLPGGSERPVTPPIGYEIGGSEQGLNRALETTQERRPEIGLVQAEAAQVAMPALPIPVPVSMSTPQSVSQTSDDGIPTVAGDDDLIEKEWVDKAKKILAETRADPYAREREVSKLQIEYIRRRYGREIGNSGD